MNGILKSGALVIVFGSAASLLLWQRLEMKRLGTECTDLRGQLGEMSSLRESNERLAEQLKAAAESSQASRKELLRLRAEGGRLHQLEQENVQLNARGRDLERQVGEMRLAVASSEKQPQPTASNAAVVASVPAMETTDLGMLELADGEGARFDLGGGTNCVVTPKALSDGGVTMQIALAVTNADGTTTELGRGRITTRPGNYGSISVSDRMIGLAVKLKTE